MNDNELEPLQKRDNETPYQYHKRLIRGKLEDKTLADYDYSELSEYVYGKRYAPDVARRMMYGSRLTLDMIDEAELQGSGNDMRGDIQSQIIELQKERQKFFDQRREHKKLIIKDARLDNLYDALAKAAHDVPFTVGDLFEDCTVDNDDYRQFSVDTDAVVVFSDWHYGLKADNIFNAFNTDICKRRVADTVRKAKQRILQHKCSRLHIIVLGDLYHGAIHVDARVASDELVCDQLMQVSEILAQAIIELSSAVLCTDVYMTYGNHARTVQNKKESIHRDNMERIIPWWLEQRFDAESHRTGTDLSITVHPAGDYEFIHLNVCGHDFCAAHGDLDTVQQSPRLLSTLFHKVYDCDIEYILLGDKHHRESFDELGITSMQCGSLCGVDDFANDHRLYSLPSQLLLIVTKEDGVDAEYRIKSK